MAIFTAEITDLARCGLGVVAGGEVEAFGRIEVAKSSSAVATDSRLDVEVVD